MKYINPITVKVFLFVLEKIFNLYVGLKEILRKKDPPTPSP